LPAVRARRLIRVKAHAAIYAKDRTLSLFCGLWEPFMTLVWREQFSVGNDVIDTDHKYLIEIINSAGTSLEAKDRSALALALDRLSRYSQEHFAREEQFAGAVGYAGTARLGESHASLLKNLDEIRAEIDGMGEQWSAAVAAHFGELLRNWLVNHVIKEDLLMKSAMQKFSPRFDPRSSVKSSG
jgi:hemerythrin